MLCTTLAQNTMRVWELTRLLHWELPRAGYMHGRN